MIIIYHANCCDGFCGAWLLSKLYPDAEFLPFSYGMKAPIEQLRGQDVIIVDFSFPHDEMLAIMSQAQTLLVFDHHVSVPLHLRELPCFVFDPNESGASLVWNHFREELVKRFPACDLEAFSRSHWLVDYTKDRDLWQWKLPNSDAVNAGIRLAQFDFAEWDELKFHKCLNEGVTLLKYRNLHVESAIKKAQHVLVETDLKSFVVPCVNETNGDFISFVGGALASMSPTTPFGMTYFQRFNQAGDVEYVFSLRSRNGLDVSKVAQHFGGGGHAAAAGFQRSKFFEEAPF